MSLKIKLYFLKWTSNSILSFLFPNINNSLKFLPEAIFFWAKILISVYVSVNKNNEDSPHLNPKYVQSIVITNV